MRYACLDRDGNILWHNRHFDEKPPDPVGKGWRIVPVAEVPSPDFNSRLETASVAYVVDGDQVVQRWTVTQRSDAEQKAEVKAEARARILARLPDWKQRNMTARGVELINLRASRPLTADEQAEAVALQAAWDWVRAVRTASDAIEAMDSIPVDFRDDKRWPE